MFIRDPWGIICIIITYLAVFYADYVVIRWIVLPTMWNNLWGTFHTVIFNVLVLLLTISHFKAVVSDPGTVPLPQTRIDFSDIHSAEPGEVDWTICTRCEMYRPPRAHHCRICKRCIRRMDHHCPWINNCVGERNQKYFIQFLIYVGVLSMYAITLIIISWAYECQDCDPDIPTKQRRIMHCVILLLESALFGLFVSAILTDQLQAILGDETGVEQIQKQGPYRPNKPKMLLLSEVCGRQHPLLWILPCSKLPLLVHRLPRSSITLYSWFPAWNRVVVAFTDVSSTLLWNIFRAVTVLKMAYKSVDETPEKATLTARFQPGNQKYSDIHFI